MTDPTSPPVLPLPIPRSAIDRALRLAQAHPPETSIRAYRNAIAVLIAGNYCTMMGFEVDLGISDALTPVLGLTLDTADLPLPNIGVLECRTVGASETSCPIPPEAGLDRMGYLVIRLDPNVRQAELLGFAATVQNQAIPLGQLQSIDDLGAYLLRIEAANIKAANQLRPEALWQWFEGAFDRGWQNVSDWLDALSDEAPASIGYLSASTLSTGVLRSPMASYRVSADDLELSVVKTVLIGEVPDAIPLLLSLDIMRFEAPSTEPFEMSEPVFIRFEDREDDDESNNSANRPISDFLSEEVEITVHVIAQPDAESYLAMLPAGLTVSIVDLRDREIASTSATDLLSLEGNSMSVEFEARVGDIFEICLEFEDISVTETIVV